MFVWGPKDLPPDAVFPVDLKELGYFINDKDQIKKISDPEQDFQFRINKHPRWNEVQRGAMNECIRNIVSARLHNLGMTTLRLPLTSTPKKPHVPILVSANLSTASRIIVVFGEPNQDLGIWAYRSVGMEGINAGSAVSLAQEILHPSANESPKSDSGNGQKQQRKVNPDTAFILANTGQLIWHCGGRRAVTQPTWHALPRRSAVDPPLTMSGRNEIPGNANWQEHIECVFEEVLAARGRLVREDAKIDVIGVAEGGLGAIRYLKSDWPSWRPYISAICLSNPLHYPHIDFIEHDQGNETGNDETDPKPEPNPNSFSSFILSRCRAYLLSPEPRGVPVAGIREHGCNCFASGEELNIECIVPAAWRDMLQWLNTAHADPGYRESRIDVRTMDGGGVEAGVV